MRHRWFAAGVLALLLALVSIGALAATTNDPGAVQQWGLTKIHVFETWALTRGGGVIVAVVDTGVDAAHPDLRGRVLPGHDFVDDDADASDTKGHGTHVAGTIAAVAGNGIGVASVAPGAKILPVRVLGSQGEGDPGDVAEGIRWAVSHGAKVVNLSLAQDDELPIAGDELLRDSRVDNAIREAARRGAVVVVAAGNDDAGGSDSTSYDSSTAGVLVVGATTKADRRAAYSNYGPGLDVVAPGGGSATDARRCAADDWIVSTWWNPTTRRSDYGGGCGTSMAVAHVSGVAALLRARGYSAAGAADRIMSTAVDIGQPGRDAQSGRGRVDAARAIGPIPTSVKPPPSSSTQGAISGATPSSAAPLVPQPARGRPEIAGPPHAQGAQRPFAGGNDRSAPIVLAAMALVGIAGAHARRARAMFRR